MSSKNRVLAGRYELLAVAGRGGMSTVFLARDLVLRKNWAVKEVLKNGMLKDRDARNDLLTEANLMKDFDHPALPKIVDIIEDEKYYYIVMDYIEGQSLDEILEKGGPLSQEEVIRLAKEVCSVFCYLHSRKPPVIYRDMKPANVILQPSGHIKVIDFGIARTFDAGKEKDTVALGTKGFAAPEQFYNKKGIRVKADARTDIFNLGAMMYNLLTAKSLCDPPYSFIPIRNINPSFSRGLEKIIIKATQQNPDNRFNSADEMLEALLNYEKLDDAYICEKRSIIKRYVRLFIIGAAVFMISLAGSIAIYVKNANTYENLILNTGDEKSYAENLKKAARLDPGRTEIYRLLADLYSKDGEVTDGELKELLYLYNENIDKVKEGSQEYLDISFNLGEALLIYYKAESDNSIRTRLLTAEPFFNAVARSGKTDYENYAFSKACVNLAGFYRKYILAPDSAFSKSAGKKECKALLEDMKKAINEAAVLNDSPSLLLTTCDAALNIMELYKAELSFNAEKSKAFEVISLCQESLDLAEKQSAALEEKSYELLKKAEALRGELNKCYRERAKERRSDD